MLWIWILGAAIGGIIIGNVTGSRYVRAALRSSINELSFSRAADRYLLLQTFRRELANVLIRRDPDNFLRIFREAHQEAVIISALKVEKQAALLTGITDKIKYYADFDLLGAEYILYSDAARTRSSEEIEAHFRNITRFQALKCALDPHWGHRFPIEELEHLERYISSVKDASLRRRVKRAMALQKAFEAGYRCERETIDVPQYENEEVTVGQIKREEYTPVIEYGVAFKQTDEFAVYSSFVHDDGRITRFYARSDRSFAGRHSLDNVAL